MASIAPVCLPANLLGPPCSVLHPCAVGLHTQTCVCTWVCTAPVLPPRGSPVACQPWVLCRASCPYLLRTPKGFQLAQAQRWRPGSFSAKSQLSASQV